MPVLPLVVLSPLLLGTLACMALGRVAGPIAPDGIPAEAHAAAGAAATARARRHSAWAAALATAIALALLLSQAPAVFGGQVLLTHADWMPSIGLHLGFRLDGLALLFALLITGIGLLIILYAAWYLGPEDPPGRFFMLLMLFMAAMLGVALSDNLLLLVVFWELTSISSFLLVGYWGTRREGGSDARKGARMALTVTGGGGLGLLAGVVLLGQIGGSYDLSVLFERGDLVKDHALYPVALGLILIGCFTKSAQWPFHFWLPGAMAAPTPVSAYLHSATMVKAGIFLLARLYPVIGGTDLFTGVVSSVGLVTMVFAAWVAVFRHDLKSLLAYSTISHLGLIVFLLGLSSPLSAVAAVFHILNHATFKASLFMTAGIIDHETGTRDQRQLGGLWRFMPWTGTLAIVAAASMAGVPLVNGFLSKEMFFDEAVRAQQGLSWGLLVPMAATLGGVCSVAYSLRFVHDAFFGQAPKRFVEHPPHEAPLFMRLPVMLLVALCVVVGVLPAVTFGPLVALAAGAVLNAPPPAHHLALWHGFNVPLAMSAVALVGGIALYAGLSNRYRLSMHAPLSVSTRWVYGVTLGWLFQAARRITGALEIGSLQRHLSWMVGVALIAGAWPWLVGGAAAPGMGERALLPADALSIAVWVTLLVAGAALVLGHHHRLQAVVLTSVIGLVTALTFVALSAPDLALTQLSVEVVSAVLLLMGLALLPPTTPRESAPWRKLRDGTLALAGGAGVAWLAWVMLTRDHSSLAWYFLQHALPDGGGTNVVNVILVDFRGYDTFGEITVLGIAGVGVMAVLHGWRSQRPATDADGRAWQLGAESPLMLRVAARVVLPLALVVSAAIFWRGHNLPGGGFIAGLVTAVALVLQYIALGQSRAELLLRAASGRRYVRWIAAGLGIAWMTGVAAMLLGHPFLTSAFGHPVVPVLGELALASAAMFDLGVYLTVVGATLLTLAVLGRASREPLRLRPAPAGATGVPV